MDTTTARLVLHPLGLDEARRIRAGMVETRRDNRLVYFGTA